MSEQQTWDFTQEEYEALIMGLARGKHPDPLIREELDRYIGWCRRAMIDAAIVRNILRGSVLVKTTTLDGSPDQMVFVAGA